MKTLCNNCRHLQQTVFLNNKGKAYCAKLYQDLSKSGYAVKCRHWQPVDQSSIEDMYRSAYILTKSKQIGYITPALVFDEPEDRPRRHFENETAGE